MPRIQLTNQAPVAPIGWQQTITDRIRRGKLLPLVSNSVGNDLVLGGHAALVEAYADYSRHPLEQRALPHTAQVKLITDDTITDPMALREDYVNFVKNRLFDLAEADGVGRPTLDEVLEQFDALPFSQFCAQLGYPRFDEPRQDPLLLLASFDLPIYLTTSYHGFVEAALRRANKSPRSDLCRWHKNLAQIPSVLDDEYVPSVQEPLVYHLHGLADHPDSLVLTEDDYLKFLVATSENFGRPSDPVHRRVRQAMSDSSLMLLGYSLREWDFRSVFWGLIDKRNRRLTSVVSVQLEPEHLEKLYLERYLGEYEFKAYWGSAVEYMQALSEEVNRV